MTTGDVIPLRQPTEFSPDTLTEVIQTVTDVEVTPIMIDVHAAGVQDRDGAPAVTAGMLEKALEVTKLWADGGCQGPKLVSKLE